MNHSYNAKVLSLHLGQDYLIDEIPEQVESCIAEYQITGTFGVLLDASHSKSMRSIDEIRKTLPDFSKLGDNVLCFAVVVNSDFHFGLANQASFYAEIAGIKVKPFKNADDAASWIRELLE